MKQTIAVLLTVYNRKEKTLLCLQNLYAQEIPDKYDMDVYLTNDGCSDGTPEAISNQFPNVRIIDGDGDLFWNRGMYVAWRTASKTKDYDFYLWLNDDTFIISEAIKRLLSEAEKHKCKSIIVGSTYATNDNTQVTYGGRSVRKGLVSDVSISSPCDMFNGNIVLIPRIIYNKIGVNDPIFHHCLGDFDYGLRASKAGFVNYVASGFYGICDLHDNMPKWSNPQISLKERWSNFLSPTGANPFEFFRYKRRHFGLISAIIIFISNFIHVLIPVLWTKKNN